MVKLKVTARVIPEAAYNAAQTSTPAGKKFLVIVRDPDESYYVGTLALEIENQYQRLYKHELGKIKYIKDEEDNDLDPEQLVLDVFVNEGKAERDGLDQDATIRIVQDQRQAVRLGSVVPDLTPVHYLPRPRPPVPRFSQVSSSLGKRLREDAAMRETPSQSKRSRQVEIAHTQQDTSMVRSIEHSPELVHDTQRSGHREDTGIDEGGNVIKAESPNLPMSLRDIEPATGEELEWLSERPHDFVSPRKRDALAPRVNGVTRGADDARNPMASRHSQLPITPPTDPAHLAPAGGRNQATVSTGSPKKNVLSTSGTKFKKSSRRGFYDVPVESDIEDSQMPMPDQPALVPRLVKNLPSIEKMPTRQPTAVDTAFAAQESRRPIGINQAPPSVSAVAQTKSANSAARDDDSDDDADLTYTSAKASTSHEDNSEQTSSSATEESDETSTSDEESISGTESSSGSAASHMATPVPLLDDHMKSNGAVDSGENKDKSEEDSDSVETGQDKSDTGAGSDQDEEDESAPAFETQKKPSKPKTTALEEQEPMTIGKAASKIAAIDTPPQLDEGPPAKKPRGRPRKDGTNSNTTTKPTLAKKSLAREMIASSVKTKGAKRGPMSKLVNEAFPRRGSDLDSPGEQLSQSLQESAKVASVPEIVQSQASSVVSKSVDGERRPSDSSAPSTPSRERIGLGITDSPRKSKSISVEIPPSSGKPSYAEKMQQMRRSSSAAADALGLGLSDKQKAPSTYLSEHHIQQPASHGKTRRKKVKNVLRKESESGGEEPTETSRTPVLSVTEEASTTHAVSASTKGGPILPPGMTLEEYQALMGTSNTDAKERQVQKPKTQKNAAAATLKEGPEIAVSKETGIDAGPPHLPTSKSKAVKRDDKTRLKVPKANQERATSSPAIDAFRAITQRLNSVQPFDKGSMPPPALTDTWKKQSSVDRQSSASGSDANRDDSSAIKGRLGTGTQTSPVPPLSTTKVARASPAASSQSVGISKHSATKQEPVSSKKATPAPVKDASSGQPMRLKALQAHMRSQRESQNSSPAPANKPAAGAAGAVSKQLQIGTDDSTDDSDEDESESDSDSDSESESDDESRGGARQEKNKKKSVSQLKPLLGVDRSIRDPTPEESDSE